MIGETERARALFEKLLSFAGPLLLYAEEIDATTGRHSGNYPQAFTHLALIDAADAGCIAVEIRRTAWRRRRRRRRRGARTVSSSSAAASEDSRKCGLLARSSNVDVTLIDRRNHHLFQPLLYQVATGILSPGQIAPPLRHVLRVTTKRARCELAEVTGFDLDRRVVHATRPPNEPIEVSVRQPDRRGRCVAVVLRSRRVRAVRTGHEDDRRRAGAAAAHLRRIRDGRDRRHYRGAQSNGSPSLSSGAGPTGVETRGQMRELATRSLRGEFRNFDAVIGASAPRRRRRGATGDLRRQVVGRRRRAMLENMGVELRMGTRVTGVDANGVDVTPPRATIGFPRVRWFGRPASRHRRWPRMLAEATGAEVDRAGRIAVLPDLTLPGHPEVFAVGDMMSPRPSSRRRRGGDAGRSSCRYTPSRDVLTVSHRTSSSTETSAALRRSADSTRSAASGVYG